jgi:SAM-dependent methyltransferase
LHPGKQARVRPSGGTDSEFVARDYVTGEGFRVVSTPAGWWSTQPVPPDLSPYYRDHYHATPGRRRFPRVVEWLQERLYVRRARQVTAAAGRVGRVLDLGCGPGHLLACFRGLGWETVGTEATPRAAEYARERYQLDVRVGDTADARFSPAEFHAVVSWHSLEHRHDPARVLDDIERVLRPGGLLLISVPDFDSPEAKANRAAWFHLDVPRHLCHFPAPVLRRELVRRGLTIEAESRWTPEYDTFSLLQTWQNRMRLPPNLLYQSLRGVGASGRRRGPWWVTLAGALAMVAFPLAVGIVAWRGWRRSGSVVTLLARKARSRDLEPAGTACGVA